MSLIYVNPSKSKREDEIVEWLKGAPTKEEWNAKLKVKYQAFVKEDKVKEEDWKEYVYKKLGGLVRTDKEHKEAKAKAKKVNEEYKKGKREA